MDVVPSGDKVIAHPTILVTEMRYEMSGRPPTTRPTETVENSLIPDQGWHCTHSYYEFDRSILADMDPDDVEAGCRAISAALDPEGENGTSRLQTSIVSGHKADFAVLAMDPNPLKIDSVHQSLLASPLGPAICPTYSFVSMTELSEYVPTLEKYRERLIREGEEQGSAALDAKVAAYEKRLPAMVRQRLTPEFPSWPATCFYPMNKKRKVGENWFDLPFSARNQMMSEHAQSGMKYMGRVMQMVTVSVGLEDWEWGVTLWARNPVFLKDIVYQMRYDKASARYAEFGPFYTSYISSPEAMLKHCRIGQCLDES